MSATADERRAALAVRDDHDREAARRGHVLRWRLGDNARRRGHAYFWEGRCEHCAAQISVGATWSSCPGVRDARKVACSGPGTAVLTEIEAGRASELVADAVTQFYRSLDGAGLAGRWRPMTTSECGQWPAPDERVSPGQHRSPRPKSLDPAQIACRIISKRWIRREEMPNVDNDEDLVAADAAAAQARVNAHKI